MINFANAQYLLLLLLIPFFFVVQALVLRMRKKRLKKFGDEELVKTIMPSYSGAKVWVRLTLFSIAFFFFAIGLSRPQIGAKLKEHETKGAEIMIVLDVSNSMLAEDYSPNRLDRAKLAISRLVDKLREDRIGLIVFAGNSFVQLPITTDYVSAKMFLNSISTESVPVQGTAIGEAINTAIRSFSAQSEKSRAIIVITDGENHEDDPVAAAAQAAELGIRVFAVGVGSPEGEVIPMEGDLLRDKNGEIVVTRLDEAVLQEVASAGNGAYVRAGNSEFGLNPIIDEIRRMEDEKYSSIVFEEFDEQFMYFLGIALFFFVLEMLIGDRRARRHLFTKGRYVIIAVCLTAASFDASAQVDKKDVRRGNRDYRKEAYDEARIDYMKALVKDSLSLAANYNLAGTLYREGEMEQAKNALDKVAESAASSPHAADYYYNLGDVAIAREDWQGAVDAFKKSLLLNPADMDAKENYIYARKKLQDQQNQDQQDQQDQNQDQQDQDQNQNQDQNKDQQDRDQDQNQDQNQNKDQQDQDQNQNQDQQDQNKDQEQPKITPQAAQQMLQAIQAKEKETQEKVNEKKAEALKSRQKDKNW